LKVPHDVGERASKFPVLGTTYQDKVLSLTIGRLLETKDIKVALCWLDIEEQDSVSLYGYFTRLEGESLSWGRLKAVLLTPSDKLS
jgi:hypothetical protein